MDVREIPPAADIDGRVASTTVTTFRIIEELDRQTEAGVTDLASALDLAKGTVHKHLATLRAVDYVVKEGDRYRLSLGFLGLGSAVRTQMAIYEVAYEPVKKLAQTTGETVNVMIPEHGLGVYVMCVSTADEPETGLREGERVPLHATAAGKSILAYTPEGRRDSILDRRGTPALTDETITDREALETELRTVHDKRIAYDQGELASDRHCLGAPVTDGDDHAVAAVSISGPADRMREKSVNADFSAILGSTANSIRNRLSRVQ